jgi:uncharacterized membrane protein YczE
VTVVKAVQPTRPYNPRSPATDIINRLIRCAGGLFLFGAGISLMLRSALGASPWEMFHQGVSRKTDISVGLIIEITGFAILLLWIPLRQRPGIGTLMNAIEIGLVVDLVNRFLPHTERLIPRIAMLLIGILIIAVGSGFYIGAGLGPGPRDGLMMGLAARGISVRLGRTVIEITVAATGLALGSRPGIGTVLFMFGIGPLVQIFLPALALPARKRTKTAQAASPIGADGLTPTT